MSAYCPGCANDPNCYPPHCDCACHDPGPGMGVACAFAVLVLVFLIVLGRVWQAAGWPVLY